MICNKCQQDKALSDFPNLPLVLKRNKFPKGYRILCHNCNLSKSFYGYCPHQGVKNAT